LRIDVTGSYPSNNQLQVLNELNLREGQKVIGKIISLSTDEALLEIAGRPLQAKVEGNPPPPGSVQMFQVKVDEQGRTILKVVSGNQETNENGLNNNVNLPSKATLQNMITSALVKEGLPPTQENVDQVFRVLQEFQAKYQQLLKPQIVAFVLAQKWPVTPGTLLTAWVFQDRGLRDSLWNTLKDSLPEGEEAEALAKLFQDINPDLPGIEEKLKNLLGLKLRDIFEKLADPNRPAKPETQGMPGKEAGEVKQPAPEKNQIVKPEEQRADENTKLPGELRKALTQVKPETQPSVAAERKTAVTPERLGIAAREKIETVLEQNLVVSRSIFKENSPNGNSNLIPLLVRDSQDMLHECQIKWKEEKNSRNDGTIDQIIYLTIPTENMGDIKMAVRSGKANTQISFKVISEEVKRYLQQHAIELKESVKSNNVNIAVSLGNSHELSPDIAGVDIWM
jgi:hypothetical protein